MPKTHVTNFDSIDGWNWNWLNHLLRNIVIPISDIGLQQSGFAITVSELKCSRIEIGSLELSNTGTQFSFSTRNTKLYCSGELAYRQAVVFVPFGSASLEVDVSGLSLDMTVALGMNHQNLPTSASLATCTADARIAMNFRGMITGNILQLFRSHVERAVENAIRSQVCVALRSVWANTVTGVLQNVVNSAQPLVVPPAPTPAPSSPPVELLVDWLNSPAMTTLEAVTARLGAPGVNRVMKAILNPETGALHIPMTQVLDLPSPYAKYRLELQGLEVKGLDSLLRFEPVFASGAQELSCFFEAKGLTLTFHTRMTLDLSVIDQSRKAPIDSRVDITIALNDLRFRAAALLGMFADYRQRFAAIPVALALQPGCWTELLPLHNLRTLGMTFQNKPLFTVHAPNAGFAATASSILQMVGDLISDAVPLVVDTMLGHTVVNTINNIAADWLSKQECVSPPIEIGATEDVRGLMPIQLLNKHVHADMVNNLMRSLSGSSVVIPSLIEVDAINDPGARLHLSVREVTLSGLDSFVNFTLLAPVARDRVITNITLGSPERPFTISALVEMQHEDKRSGVVRREAYEWSVGATGITTYSEATMLVSAFRYYSLALGDLKHGDIVLDVLDRFVTTHTERRVGQRIFNQRSVTGHFDQLPFYDIINSAVLDAVLERLPMIAGLVSGKATTPNVDDDDDDDEFFDARDNMFVVNAAVAEGDEMKGFSWLSHTVDARVTALACLCVGLLCASVGTLSGVAIQRRRNARKISGAVRAHIGQPLLAPM